MQEANHTPSGIWSKFGRCSGGGWAGGLDFLAQMPNPIIAPAMAGPAAPGPLASNFTVSKTAVLKPVASKYVFGYGPAILHNIFPSHYW